jgi:hypothetical protein
LKPCEAQPTHAHQKQTRESGLDVSEALIRSLILIAANKNQPALLYRHSIKKEARLMI